MALCAPAFTAVYLRMTITIRLTFCNANPLRGSVAVLMASFECFIDRYCDKLSDLLSELGHCI